MSPSDATNRRDWFDAALATALSEVAGLAVSDLYLPDRSDLGWPWCFVQIGDERFPGGAESVSSGRAECDVAIVAHVLVPEDASAEGFLKRETNRVVALVEQAFRGADLGSRTFDDMRVTVHSVQRGSVDTLESDVEGTGVIGVRGVIRFDEMPV